MASHKGPIVDGVEEISDDEGMGSRGAGAGGGGGASASRYTGPTSSRVSGFDPYAVARGQSLFPFSPGARKNIAGARSAVAFPYAGVPASRYGRVYVPSERLLEAIYHLFLLSLTPITMGGLVRYVVLVPGGGRRSRQRQRQRGGMLGGPNAVAAPAAAAAAASEPPVNPVVELRAGVEAVTQNARGGVASIYDRIGRSVRAVGTYFTALTGSFDRVKRTLLYLLGLNTVIFGSSAYRVILPVFETIFTTPVLFNILWLLFTNTAEGVAAVGMVGAVGASAIGIGSLVLFLGWLLRRCSSLIYNRIIRTPIELITEIADQDVIPPAAIAALDAARRVVIDAAAASAAAAEARAAAAAARAADAEALAAANEETTIISVPILAEEDTSALVNGAAYHMNDTIANIRLLVTAKQSQGHFTAAVAKDIRDNRIGAAVGAAQVAARADEAAAAAELRAAPPPAIEDGAAAAAAASPFGGGGGAGSGGGGASSSSASAAAAAASPGSTGGSGGGGFGGGYRRIRNKQNKKSKKRQNRKQNSKKSRRLRFRF